MTRPVFERCMALMAATWPDRKPTPETLAAYWMALSDLDNGVFEAAVAACIKGCTFYPKPAEIIAKAEQVLGAAGALPADGERAWEELLRLMAYWSPDNGWCAPVEWVDGKPHWGQVGAANGYYGAPSPLPELTARVVHMLGGLESIKYASSHDLGFLRRDFLDFYGRKRDEAIRYGPLLTQPLAPRQLAERMA